MKAASFEYEVADNLDHALELLETYQQDVKLIAGGQSLVPMMAMRLARPSRLIDMRRLGELKKIKLKDDSLVTGALLSQSLLEHSKEILQVPLLKQAIPWVGHQQIRNRGTVGGSLAHADPSAELPLISIMLNATLSISNQHIGQRNIPARDFYLGPMWTILEANDCLTEIHWPIWQGSYLGSSFMETSMRHGDFAMASAATQLQVSEEKKISRIEIGLGGMGGIPLTFPNLAQQLIGQSMNDNVALEMAADCVALTDPSSDLHASEKYRRHLAKKLLSRTLVQAYKNALEKLN